MTIGNHWMVMSTGETLRLEIAGILAKFCAAL